MEKGQIIELDVDYVGQQTPLSEEDKKILSDFFKKVKKKKLKKERNNCQ